MVGQGRGYYLDVSADETSGDALILAHLDNVSRQVEGRLNFVRSQVGGDDETFRALGVPTARLTWERAEYQDSPSDAAELIDPRKLQATGRVVALALMTLADKQ
jgi:hypothetical protein